MKEFIRKIKKRIHQKAIYNVTCCHWGEPWKKPLTKEDVEELLKEIYKDEK